MTDHAINVLKVAFYFRHLLNEHYPKDTRSMMQKIGNAFGRGGRSLTDMAGRVQHWHKNRKDKEYGGEGIGKYIPKNKPDEELKREARKEIKE
jgi:hypothetical protein